MNLGLVIYGALDQRSGGYLYDRKLVEALQKSGDRVELISLPPRRYAHNLLDNFDPGVRRRLGTRPFDLLLQDELNHPSLFWLNRGLHSAGLPIVAIVHLLRSGEPRARALNWAYCQIERSYLRSVSGAVFVSRATQAAAEALLKAEIPGVVAHPGRDPLSARIDQRVIEARAAQSGPLRLVFLGNLIRRKGLHTLLDALRLLPEGTAELSVIGSPEFDPSYARWIRHRIGRMNRPVRLLGSLPHAAIEEHLMQAQVLVMPSAHEGFAIAYLEGMGCGLPVIAGSAGGATELVQEGENGFLVRPDDPVGLAERIARLAGDRALLSAMGNRALASFEAHPTWGQSAGRVRSFLGSIVDHARPLGETQRVGTSQL
ncbi:MAG: glycosyltransferase family 4 protein [Anaerolineales bacterium]